MPSRTRATIKRERLAIETAVANIVGPDEARRLVGWLRKRHLGLNMHTLVKRFLPGWTIREDGIELFRPSKIAIERYRFRGTRIPTPWSGTPTA